jgi:ATP-dependent Lhr-like helicase
MSSAFDRLSGAMQYQIVNGLGFSGLRPVQEMAIDAILDGKNCVVLAPTAGGKTEAAFFPLFSQMDAQDWRPVSVIYVAPLRALLNNQEERLSRYAQLIGRRAFKWHGDVTDSLRRAFVNEPADLLLTTPESLEVMLMSRRVPARELFKNLRAVVIDEVHAFVADDRGGHLSSLLERLSRFCGHDVQRIGLSATIGNPDEILRWAAGSSKRVGEVVTPPRLKTTPELKLDYVGNLQNAAQVIAGLHQGEKRLVFADSRAKVEGLGAALTKIGVRTYITHSALAREVRERAEQAFAGERDCVIVATSALELGIDIGDLDRVLQIDCPTTVASFLQRMGRSGRRAGTQANCTFLATDGKALVQTAALLRLYKSGFVESVQLRRRAFHLLAHQLLALTIQESGVPVSDWWGWISTATPFSGIGDADRAALFEHMVAEGIVTIEAGLVELGLEGERLYGFRHFMELYSVFQTPRMFTVLWGTQEIGTLEALFVQSSDANAFVFTLGARSWRAVRIDWDNGLVHAEPMQSDRLARWIGQPRMLGRELCETIRQVLTSSDIDAEWSQRAVAQLTQARTDHAFLSPQGCTLQDEAGELRLWTFAGGRANGVLARVLEELLGARVTNDNLAVVCRDGAAKSAVGLSQALEKLVADGRPSDEDAVRLAGGLARGTLSKFQQCLTPRLEAEYLADVLVDAAGARAAAGTALESGLVRPDANQ